MLRCKAGTSKPKALATMTWYFPSANYTEYGSLHVSNSSGTTRRAFDGLAGVLDMRRWYNVDGHWEYGEIGTQASAAKGTVVFRFLIPYVGVIAFTHMFTNVLHACSCTDSLYTYPLYALCTTVSNYHD